MKLTMTFLLALECDDFSRYISEFPGNKEAYEMRALGYRKLNRTALAEADEKKAAELK